MQRARQREAKVEEVGVVVVEEAEEDGDAAGRRRGAARLWGELMLFSVLAGWRLFGFVGPRLAQNRHASTGPTPFWETASSSSSSSKEVEAER